VPKDAHVPDFARRPYEPFGRQAAVAIALREWRLFGQPVQEDVVASDEAGEDPEAKPERQPGLWQRVGEYWWLGMDAGRPERAWTGKHGADGTTFPPTADAHYAWSAAFISYVMRIAGAGARFPYAERHATYINLARRAAATNDARWAVRAVAPTAYPPQLGDLICFGRGDDRDLRFEDLPAPPFPGHCDIVVGQASDRLTVIGGNVEDAVTLKHVPIAPDGRLVAADGSVVDARYPWFVVIRVLYDR
jgi:hypothetical protein